MRRCPGLVPWRLTLFAGCHGLVPWSFTFVAKKKSKQSPDATGLSRGAPHVSARKRPIVRLHGTSPWHPKSLLCAVCSDQRKAPRDKPVASSEQRKAPRDKPVASSEQRKAPRDKPVASSEQRQTPRDKPVASSEQPKSPRDKPAASRTTPVDRKPANVRNETSHARDCRALWHVWSVLQISSAGR